MNYQIMKTGVVMILDSGRREHIPCGSTNIEWVKYQDWLSKGNIPLSDVSIVEEGQYKEKVNTIRAEILAELPTWAVVSNAVDNITTLPQAKVFMKRLARIVYLLVKQEVD